MRKYYLDNIRWLVVVLVVLYHVIFMYNGIIEFGVIGPFRSVQYQDSIQYLLYPWFMMILFIISGISSRLSLEKQSDKTFFRSRTVKLLVPSTIGLFVFQWLQGYVSMKISNAFVHIPNIVPKPVLYLIMVLSGTGVLWYIQTLWLFSLLLIIIRKITKKKEKLYPKTENLPLWSILLLGVAVWIFAQILNMPMITVYRFGIYGISFFLGYYIFAHEKIMDRLSSYCIPLFVAAIISGIAFTVYYWGENFAESPVVNSPLCILYGWLMCLAVFGCMKKYGNRKTAFTEWMTKRSFGLYVFHYLPLSYCAYLLDRYTDVPAVAAYLLTGISAFGIGYLLNEIISGIPLIRWCVLGIRAQKTNKEKNHVS